MARGGVIGKRRPRPLDWPGREPDLRLIVTVLALLLALPASADERPPGGLLWNRSGLPATLPLQVHSPAGLDHVVMLTHPDETAAKVAGYVRGGAFFRILVPPGDWQISFASGTDWQGEPALFGPETRRVALPDPLHFGVADGARLEGHVLRLETRDGDTRVASVGPQTICRVADWQGETRDLRTGEAIPSTDLRAQRPQSRRLQVGPDRTAQRPSLDQPLRYQHQDFSLRSVLCE